MWHITFSVVNPSLFKFKRLSLPPPPQAREDVHRRSGRPPLRHGPSLFRRGFSGSASHCLGFEALGACSVRPLRTPNRRFGSKLPPFFRDTTSCSWLLELWGSTCFFSVGGPRWLLFLPYRPLAQDSKSALPEGHGRRPSCTRLATREMAPFYTGLLKRWIHFACPVETWMAVFFNTKIKRPPACLDPRAFRSLPVDEFVGLVCGLWVWLVGMKGDSTSSNLQEARMALWEETIIPLLDHISESLRNLLSDWGASWLLGTVFHFYFLCFSGGNPPPSCYS